MIRLSLIFAFLCLVSCDDAKQRSLPLPGADSLIYVKNMLVPHVKICKIVLNDSGYNDGIEQLADGGHPLSFGETISIGTDAGVVSVEAFSCDGILLGKMMTQVEKGDRATLAFR